MTAPAAEPTRPYGNLVDPRELARVERATPGGAERVLSMIEADMRSLAKQIEVQEKHEHSTRVLSIWLTMVVVVGIAGMATGVILTGYQVAGSILATVDLVALANVFINSWRRQPIQ